MHHVARQLERKLSNELDHDELVSAGTLGLMSAMSAFDPSRGLAFSTFAVPRTAAWLAVYNGSGNEFAAASKTVTIRVR